MKFKLALLAAAGTTAMFSTAFAQEQTGYYGALGAGVVLDNDDVDFESDSSTPAFDADMEVGSNVAIYGAIGRYYQNGFRGEIEFATRTQEVEEIPGDGLGFAGFPSSSDLGDLTVSTLMLNVYKDFAFDASGLLHPYVGAGIGAAYVRPEFDNISSPTAAEAGGPSFSNRVIVADKDYVAAAQAMAGITYDFTDNMVVDLRYRYLKTGEVDYGGYVNSPQNDYIADLSTEYDAHEIVAGFRWNFGPTATVVEEPEPVQYKTCWDGSQVEVTMDCPPMLEEEEVVTEIEPLVVYFDYDKSNLTDAARTLIAARADEAISADVAGVNVEGNTDTSGSSAYNQALSARRAKVVSDALVANGIDSSIITMEALGESNPAKPTADGVKEPLNRRTEVTFEF